MILYQDVTKTSCIIFLKNLEMLVFWERGKPENPEKNLLKTTNNELNPHLTLGPGIEPGTHWWKASALTTAPSLLPLTTRTP